MKLFSPDILREIGVFRVKLNYQGYHNVRVSIEVRSDQGHLQDGLSEVVASEDTIPDPTYLRMEVGRSVR